MRKLMSLLLAVVMVMSLATVAFAATEYEPTPATEKFTITKTYESDEEFIPGETLTFVVEADAANPDTPMISLDTAVEGQANTYTYTIANTAATEFAINVNIPSYDTAGIYKYTIKELEGKTAGVTYDKDKTIHVVILVEYDNENNALIFGNGKDDNGVTIWIEDLNGKVDDFNNNFDTQDLTIYKNVEGNMSDKTHVFEVKVDLSVAGKVLTAIKVAGTDVAAGAWTYDEENNVSTYQATVSISEDTAATIENLPNGTKVTAVTESKNELGYTYVNTTMGDIAANNSENPEEFAEFTITADENKITVRNEKTAEVSTGVITDSAPYIILIAVCSLAAVLFVTKRRSVEF